MSPTDAQLERIVGAASVRFFWPSASRDDVAQEARLALVKARPATLGLAKAVVHRHLIEQVRRETRRRPQFVELGDGEDRHADVHTVVEARDLLHRVARAPLTELEREAVRRVAVGLPCPKPVLGNALHRARRKLAREC